MCGHDAFDNRKASSMEYYDMRNTLIACAIHHPKYSRLHMIKRVARHLIGQMLHLRVKDQELTMKGVEDFCKGTEFLKELDPTKLHPEIMKMGYAMQDVSDDLHKFGVDVEKTKPQPSHLYEDGGFAKKHLLSVNGWLLPAKKETAVLPMGVHPVLCIAKNGSFIRPGHKPWILCRTESKRFLCNHWQMFQNGLAACRQV